MYVMSDSGECDESFIKDPSKVYIYLEGDRIGNPSIEVKEENISAVMAFDWD